MKSFDMDLWRELARLEELREKYIVTIKKKSFANIKLVHEEFNAKREALIARYAKREET